MIGERGQISGVKQFREIASKREENDKKQCGIGSVGALRPNNAAGSIF
jgi:hypothetical protein